MNTRRTLITTVTLGILASGAVLARATRTYNRLEQIVNTHPAPPDRPGDLWLALAICATLGTFAWLALVIGALG